MLYSLQSLRVVFALCIFFHHLDLFEAGGSCGVSFFLLLSGFVLAAGYGDRVGRADFSYRQYMMKRLVRLLPIHWITLLLALFVDGVVCGKPLSGGPLLANVLLLQSWFPWYDYFFSGNAVSWYLSDLLFFYALFPLLIKGWYRMYAYRWMMMGAGAFLLVCYLLFQAVLPELYGNQLLYIHPLFRLIDFGLGVLCYGLFARMRSYTLSSRQGTLLEGLSLLLLAGACVLYDYVPLNMTYALIFWLPSAAVLLAFALGERNGGRISAVLCRRFWHKPAAWSFSFYMVHQLVIRMLDAWMPGMTAGLRMLLCFLASALLAALLYEFLEKPVTAYGRNRINAYLCKIKRTNHECSDRNKLEGKTGRRV